MNNKSVYEVDEINTTRYGEPVTIRKGDVFTYLTVEKLYSNKKIDCVCKCGNHVYGLKPVTLISGNTKSCGCYNSELTTNRNKTHGESKTRLYKIWQGMKKRCLNPNCESYKNYGGRGIKVFDEWLNWEPFKIWALNSGYTEEMTIERIDVNGDYRPDNCTWIPKSEQSKNRRSCNFITYNGETHTLTEWASILGINRTTLSNRIVIKGWDVEKAFTTPIEVHNTPQ